MTKEKLVRDKIPEIIRSNGGIPVVRIASADEMDQLLRSKILEEAQELLDSGETVEIADIIEAIHALVDIRKLDIDEVEDIRKKKREDRGGFQEGFVLKLD